MKLYILLTTLLLTQTALAQGTVFLANRVLVDGIDAPLFDTDETTRLGSEFWAQLAVGADMAGPFQAVGSPVSLIDHPETGEPTGYFVGGTVQVPFPPGEEVYALVQVWEKTGGASWDAAKVAGKRVGLSSVIQVRLGGEGWILPTPPANLVGLPGFSVTLPVVVDPVVLDVEIAPEGSGTATGAGTFERGTLASINAVPVAGFRFDHWEGEGVADPSAADTTVEMTTDRAVIAHFVRQFSLAVAASPAESAVVTGAGTFDEGLLAPIAATVTEGWQFDHWEGEGVSEPTAPSTTVRMSTGRSVVAVCVKQWVLAMLTSPAEGGSVTGAGLFDDGAMASISAVPAAGYRFDHWGGEGVADPSAADTTVEMATDRAVIAHFVRQYSLAVAAFPADGAMVTGAGMFDEGFLAPIVATATEGWRFDHWEGEGVTEPTAAATTVAMTKDRTVVAHLIRQFQLQGGASPMEGGTVLGLGTLDAGTLATLRAVPAPGFRFNRWEGEAVTEPTSPETTVLVDQDRTVTAFFIQTADLVLSAFPAEAGETTGSGIYDLGTLAPIHATPATGHRFDHWEGDGIDDPLAAETTVLVDQDRSLTAVFVKVWRLTLSALPADGGTVSGAGEYDGGESAGIQAVEASGYRFQGWDGEGVSDPNSLETSVLMDQDRDLVAVFQASVEMEMMTFSISEGFAFEIRGPVNASVVVEVSSDLKGWSEKDRILLTDGRGRFEETQPAREGAQFYRVRVSPE